MGRSSWKCIKLHANLWSSGISLDIYKVKTITDGILCYMDVEK